MHWEKVRGKHDEKLQLHPTPRAAPQVPAQEQDKADTGRNCHRGGLHGSVRYRHGADADGAVDRDLRGGEGIDKA